MSEPTKAVIVYVDRYWSFIPRLVHMGYFDALYRSLYEKTGRYPISIRGKEFTSRRRSCSYTRDLNRMDGRIYGGMPRYGWGEAPRELIEIRDVVGYFAGAAFDYVLCHIYENGSDYIGYHRDSEALRTPIVSVSLGPRDGGRKFRFRRIGKTCGWEEEFFLRSGDVLIMHGPSKKRPGCQEVYKHAVPATKMKVGPRINLTFRMFE